MSNIERENEEIDLLQVLLLPVKYYFLIVLLALVGAVAAYFLATEFVQEKYTSSTSIYMQNQSNENAATSSDLTAAGYFANDAKVLITSNYVLEKTIDELQLSCSVTALKNKIKVEVPTSTRWLNLSVEDTDPERAADIVNALSEISAEAIVSVMGAKNAEVVDRGKVAAQPSSPNLKKWVLCGFALGFILTYGVFILKNILNDKIHDAGDVTKYLELPVLASIPVENVKQ